MPNRFYPAALYNRSNSYVSVEDGATQGATLGVNLYKADGTIVNPADVDVAAHVAAGDPHPQYLTPAEAASLHVLKAGDTMTGNLDLNGGTVRVRNFGGTPAAGVVYFGDVATDNYIYKHDSQFDFRFGTISATLNSGGTLWTTGNFTPTNYVLKSGDTMTGNLTNNTAGSQISWQTAADARILIRPNGPYSYIDAVNGANTAFAALGMRAASFSFEAPGNFSGALTQGGNQVWHAGNDGSGSGLDADTVDGIDGTQIVFGTTANKTGDYGSDWNAAKPSGFWEASAASNGPVAGWNWVINVRHSNTGNHYGYQLANPIGTAELHVRGVSSGSWSAWYKVITTAHVSDAASLGTVVQRNPSGYIYANYFNTNAGTSTTGPTAIYVEESNDGFIRKHTMNQFLSVDCQPYNAKFLDIYAARADGTGVIFFGSTGARYVYWDGTNYNLPGGSGVVAVNFTATSDARLKEDITYIPTRDLSSLGLATWEWKESGDSGLGPIAQDVQAVAPEYVVTGKDGYLSVDKGGLALEIAMKALEEVKRLQGIIDALTRQSST